MWSSKQDVREFLGREFRNRTDANPRYSLRAFARQLQLSAGELSEILSGKRPISLKNAAKIAAALHLNSAERGQLFAVLSETPAEAVATPRSERGLELETFSLISDWYCFALLNLLKTRACPQRPAHIAKRLGIGLPEVRSALDRLRRAGLIERRGLQYFPTDKPIQVGKQIPSSAIRQYHRRILALAQDALEDQTVEEREFQGLSLPVRRADLPRMKKRIAEFIGEMAQSFSKPGESDEVYHLELGLFRMTHPIGEGNA